MTVSPTIRLFAVVGVLAAAAMAGAMLLLSRTQSADAAAPLPLPRHVVARPEPAVGPKPVTLSRLLAPALRRHRVVVAAVYARGASPDQIALKEARAGAARARVGFAALDVSRRRVALAVAREVDAIEAPAVLVLDRTGAVKVRLDGFADRQLVAQLAGAAR